MIVRLLLLALGVAAISSAAVMIKQTDAPALTIAFYRMFISAIVIWPFYLTRSERMSHPGHRSTAVVGGIFLAAHFALWISSLKYTSVANSLILVTMNPIFVGIGSVWILREKTTLLLIIGTCLSIAGCSVLLLGDVTSTQANLEGNMLALAGAVGMSGYMLVGRKVRQEVALIPYVAWVYGVAALILGVICVIAGTPLVPGSPETFVRLLLIALIPQILGHTSINWVLRYVPPSYVAVVILLEPVLGSLMAYWILSEAITGWTAVGGTLVLSGIVTALVRTSESKK